MGVIIAAAAKMSRSVSRNEIDDGCCHRCGRRWVLKRINRTEKDLVSCKSREKKLWVLLALSWGCFGVNVVVPVLYKCICEVLCYFGGWQ